MARNKDIFNAIAGVPHRNAIKRPQDMTTRENYSPDTGADWVTPEHADPVEYGGTQAPVGMYGHGGQMAGLIGGNPGLDIENMSDAYDYWAQWSQNPGSNTSQYPTFLDWWFQNTGQSGDYYGDAPGDQTWFMDQSGPFGGQGSGGYGVAGGMIDFGGGAIGGAGDLGYGSFFAGGVEEGNITNPFGEGWGSEGQLGDPYEVDPNWNPWGSDCLAMYQASGAVDTYEDFANAMCG